MDQLKLLLEYKFWILAGVALLLPPIGWYAATDDLATKTSVRVTKIDDTEKQVGNLKDPQNEKWIAGVKEIDRELNASVNRSQERLYEHQKPVMTTPGIVQQALDKCKLTYRHEGTVSDDFLNARDFFVQSYSEDWHNAVKIVKPFSMTTGEGLIVLPDPQQQQEGGITRHWEVESWRQSLGFTAGQMWDVQDDVWFLRCLMQAIARVNEGTTELGNSRIKKISEATLRGGDLSDLKLRQAGNTGSKPGATATRPGTGMHLAGMTGSSGPGVESTYKPPKPFDPDDIFGDDGSKGSATGDPRGRKFDVASTPTVVKHWFDDTPKWKTRGFVLKLVMDEREIPSLLTSLTQSAFPVEILHVEHSVHLGGPGTDLSRATQSAATATVNTDGAEQQPSREQQELQRKVQESLNMAFRMHYLSDVIVAGKFTIYLEPASARSKSAVAAAPASSSRPASASPASGTAIGKAAGSAAKSPIGVPTKSVAGSATPAAKSPSSSLGKAPPGPAAQPVKAAPSASVPVSGKKTNPVPTQSGPSAK
jgi:hypothetical protein